MLTDLLVGFFSFFPVDPIQDYILHSLIMDEDIMNAIAYFNYFVPVGTFLSILQVWVVCVSVYYIFKLWWVKK